MAQTSSTLVQARLVRSYIAQRQARPCHWDSAARGRSIGRQSCEGFSAVGGSALIAAAPARTGCQGRLAGAVRRPGLPAGGDGRRVDGAGVGRVLRDGGIRGRFVVLVLHLGNDRRGNDSGSGDSAVI